MNSQGTRTLEELKALKTLVHLKGTWALGHLRHSGTRKERGHSKTQGTWTLDLSDTWALGHLKDTWAAETFELLCAEFMLYFLKMVAPSILFTFYFFFNEPR